MHQVSSSEILITQHTEDEIYNGCGRLDIRVLYETRWIEFGEGEFINKLFQRHTILQADRNRNGKAVHHATHSSSFFGHIDEDLAQCSISIFSCTEEDGLSIDLGFLSKASTLGWQ